MRTRAARGASERCDLPRRAHLRERDAEARMELPLRSLCDRVTNGRASGSRVRPSVRREALIRIPIVRVRAALVWASSLRRGEIGVLLVVAAGAVTILEVDAERFDRSPESFVRTREATSSRHRVARVEPDGTAERSDVASPRHPSPCAHVLRACSIVRVVKRCAPPYTTWTGRTGSRGAPVRKSSSRVISSGNAEGSDDPSVIAPTPSFRKGMAMVHNVGCSRVLRVSESRVVHGECLDVLRSLPDASVDLVYIDPPFNTGRAAAPRIASHGARRRRRPHRLRRPALPHRARRRGRGLSPTAFDDYLAFLEPRLARGAPRARRPPARLYFHIDYREVHYCKVLLDRIFGRDVVPQRDHLGLRLRRAHDEALARQARQHPVLRQGPERATSSTPTRSIASRTWRPASSGRRRRRAASSRPTRGGTPSSARPARRSSATRRRSRSASCAASSRASRPGRPRARLLRRQRHDGRRRARARSDASSWSTRAPRRSRR